MLALVALWSAVPAFRGAAEAISYPFQLDPIESKILQHALWLERGEPIYRPLGAEPPWVVGNYPPLYPWLCSLGVNPQLPSLAWPRLIVTVSTLAAGLALGFLVWTASRQWGLAVLAPALWWSSYEVFWWVPLARVDLPALALTAWGLALASLWLGRWTWPRAAVVCGLFWLAWLTRQSQILLPLGLVGWLALSDRRWALRLGLLWAGGVAALLVCLAAMTRGLFWTLTVTCNVNAWDAAQMGVWVRHLLGFWPEAPWLLGVGAVGVGVLRIAGPRAGATRGSGTELLASALLFNVANVIATGKAGAASNYLLEPLWCGLGLVVLVWHVLAEGTCEEQACSQRPGLAIARSLVFGVYTGFLALLVMTAATSRIPETPLFDGLLPERRVWRAPISEAERRRDLEIEAAFRGASGPVLAEYGIYALRTGRDIVWEPFLMSQLAREGRWDEAPLLARVASGEFALVLLRDDVADPAAFDFSVTPAFAAALRSAYSEQSSWPGLIPLHLWRPAPRSP